MGGFPEMSPELTALDVERLKKGVSKTLKGLGKRLIDFHKLLGSPPSKEPMMCTYGKLDPPLGNTRLHIVKLVAAVLMTNTPNINQQLSELQIFSTLLVRTKRSNLIFIVTLYFLSFAKPYVIPKICSV